MQWALPGGGPVALLTYIAEAEVYAYIISFLVSLN